MRSSPGSTCVRRVEIGHRPQVFAGVRPSLAADHPAARRARDPVRRRKRLRSALAPLHFKVLGTDRRMNSLRWAGRRGLPSESLTCQAGDAEELLGLSFLLKLQEPGAAFGASSPEFHLAQSECDLEG